MKKSKLVLLTVLIILVLYCGVVIFITKPNAFAFDSIIKKSADSAATAATAAAAKTPAEEKAEHDALVAEMETIAAKHADSAVEKAGKNADAAIKEALGKLEVKDGEVDVASLVKMAVEDAVAEAKAEIIQEASSIATSNILSHEDEVIDAVTDKILANEDEFVQTVLNRVLENEDEFAKRVTDSVLAKLEQALNEALEELAAYTPQNDYEAQRKQIRESEIQKLLEQLHD